MVKATPAQIAYLENEYQTRVYPVEKHIMEGMADEVQLTFEWIRRWFYRRHYKEQPQQPLPPPPPPQPQHVVAPIVGSTQIILQPQPQPQQHELTLDDFLDDSIPDDNFVSDPAQTEGLLPQMHWEVAAQELTAVCTDPDSTFWVNDSGRDVLVPSAYQSFLSSLPDAYSNIEASYSNIEASRDVRDFRMDYKELAAMLMEGNWSVLFPFMVAKEATTKVFSLFEDPDAFFNLIYKEFRLTTPGVAKRKVNILRACKEVCEGALVVVEVSYKPNQIEDGCEANCHRCASGCLIKDLNNGISRVIWVENMGVSEINQGGMAFGAKVMLDLLESSCERKKIQNSICSIENRSFDEHFCEKEKKNLMHFGQSMVKDLFYNIIPYEEFWSSSTEGSNGYAAVYPLAPNIEVAVGAITFKVAQSPKSVLNIIGDELMRHERDVLGGLRRVQPLKHYATGNDSQDKISISVDPTNDRVLIQEVAASKGGSLVVWSLVSRGVSYHISLGKELPLETRPLLSIVSGVSISTDSDTGGSLITLVLRQLVDGNQQSQQATDSIRSAVNETIGRIREALQKPRTPTAAAAAAAAGNSGN